MTRREAKALKVLMKAVEDVAALDEYPPAPGYYSLIKMQWRQMVRKARRAKQQADELLAEGAPTNEG
jgi:hypothetical protein